MRVFVTARNSALRRKHLKPQIQSLSSWRDSSRGVEARDDRWLHVRDMLQGQPHPARPQDAPDQKAPGIRHLD